MIQSFKDEGTMDVFNGLATRKARRACPCDDLRIPPGNRLEMLAGNRKGRHSIRINEQYRICFVWSEDGPRDVEIVDYHD
jgi:toxin HigB-1